MNRTHEHISIECSVREIHRVCFFDKNPRLSKASQVGFFASTRQTILSIYILDHPSLHIDLEGLHNEQSRPCSLEQMP